MVAEKIFKLCRVLVMVAGPGSLYMRAFDYYEGLGGCWCCGSEYVALLLQIPSKGHLAVFLGGGVPKSQRARELCNSSCVFTTVIYRVHFPDAG